MSKAVDPPTGCVEGHTRAPAEDAPICNEAHAQNPETPGRGEEISNLRQFGQAIIADERGAKNRHDIKRPVVFQQRPVRIEYVDLNGSLVGGVLQGQSGDTITRFPVETDPVEIAIQIPAVDEGMDDAAKLVARQLLPQLRAHHNGVGVLRVARQTAVDEGGPGEIGDLGHDLRLRRGRAPDLVAVKTRTAVGRPFEGCRRRLRVELQ